MERNQCPSYCMLFHNLVCLNSIVSISTRIMYGQLGSKVKDIHKNKWNKVLINLLFVFNFFSTLYIQDITRGLVGSASDSKSFNHHG